MKKMMFAVPIVVVVGLVRSALTSSPPHEGEKGQPLPAKFRVVPPNSNPRVAEVVRMRPEEWRVRFDEDAVAPDPRIQEDIESLSGDLQELLDKGADPRGEDARVYAEAILALLDCRGER